MRINELKIEYVTSTPDKLQQGVLYISKRFELAIHLCACGECGIKTVMPIAGPYKWDITYNPDETVTFRPSVGNQNFPCKSHYYITNNKIDWL